MSIAFKKYAWSKFPFCSWCGILLNLHESSVDHIKPKSEGGYAENWANYCLACKDCNASKSSSDWGVPRFGIRLIRPKDYLGLKGFHKLYGEYLRYKEASVFTIEIETRCWFCGEPKHKFTSLCEDAQRENFRPCRHIVPLRKRKKSIVKKENSYDYDYSLGHRYGGRIAEAGLNPELVLQFLHGSLGFVRGYKDRLKLKD